MPGRIAERVFALLDWCWPLPLGVLVGALVFAISAGIWRASNARRRASQTASPALTQSRINSAALQEKLPAPSQSQAPEVPNSPAAGDAGASASIGGNAPVAGTPFRSAPPVSLSASGPQKGGAPGLPPPEMASAAKVPPTHPQGSSPRAGAEPKAASASSQLTPSQKAELSDKLTLGRFFMDRQDYSAALAEFQAAQAIDPSDREVQTAVRQAREAGSRPGSAPPP